MDGQDRGPTAIAVGDVNWGKIPSSIVVMGLDTLPSSIRVYTFDSREAEAGGGSSASGSSEGFAQRPPQKLVQSTTNFQCGKLWPKAGSISRSGKRRPRKGIPKASIKPLGRRSGMGDRLLRYGRAARVATHSMAQLISDRRRGSTVLMRSAFLRYRSASPRFPMAKCTLAMS